MKTFAKWLLVGSCAAMVMGFAYWASAAGDAPKAVEGKAADTKAVDSKAAEGKADTPVVIGKSGKKYHVEGCKQLNDDVTKLTLGEATVKGYTPCGSCKPPVLTVYVTKSGKSYHNDGCASLASSKTAMTFADAIAQGYEPCKKCNPPAMPKEDTTATDKTDKKTDKK